MVEQDEQAANAAGGDALDPRTLNFSQAQGYEPLPQPLVLGELNLDARVRLWSLLYQHAVVSGLVMLSWQEILATLHVEFFALPIDTYYVAPEYLTRMYKPFIMERDQQNGWKTPFNHIFDLFQNIMRRLEYPENFIQSVNTVFKECRLAYVVNQEYPVTILPAATDQEGQALLSTMNHLRGIGLSAASEYLRKAGDLINQGMWADSIRESINAVESVARQIAPGTRTPVTLGRALNSLEKERIIPSELKVALDKLYQYSNQPGIRHAVLDNKRAQTGQDEAVFMLGACASVASYLWRKHQTSR